MARHSIDYALLTVESGTAGEPVGRRIGVDNPYEAPKVLLLDAVASANRCRAIWSSGFGVPVVAVQHQRRKASAEGHPGKTPMRL